MLMDWSSFWVSETRRPRHRATSFGILQNSTPFRRTWKTCGSEASIHQRSQSSRSTVFSRCGRWWSEITSSGRQPAWNWTVFLLSNLSTLAWRVSFGRQPSRWPVWLVDWNELADLPQLQSIKLGDNAFTRCQSVVFESSWTERVAM